MTLEQKLSDVARRIAAHPAPPEGEKLPASVVALLDEQSALLSEMHPVGIDSARLARVDALARVLYANRIETTIDSFMDCATEALDDAEIFEVAREAWVRAMLGRE